MTRPRCGRRRGGTGRGASATCRRTLRSRFARRDRVHALGGHSGSARALHARPARPSLVLVRRGGAPVRRGDDNRSDDEDGVLGCGDEPVQGAVGRGRPERRASDVGSDAGARAAEPARSGVGARPGRADHRRRRPDESAAVRGRDGVGERDVSRRRSHDVSRARAPGGDAARGSGYVGGAQARRGAGDQRVPAQPETSRRCALSDPCVRHAGPCRAGAAVRARVRQDRARGVPRTAHAGPHLLPARHVEGGDRELPVGMGRLGRRGATREAVRQPLRLPQPQLADRDELRAGEAQGRRCGDDDVRPGGPWRAGSPAAQSLRHAGRLVHGADRRRGSASTSCSRRSRSPRWRTPVPTRLRRRTRRQDASASHRATAHRSRRRRRPSSSNSCLRSPRVRSPHRRNTT